MTTAEDVRHEVLHLLDEVYDFQEMCRTGIRHGMQWVVMGLSGGTISRPTCCRANLMDAAMSNGAGVSCLPQPMLKQPGAGEREALMVALSRDARVLGLAAMGSGVFLRSLEGLRAAWESAIESCRTRCELEQEPSHLVRGIMNRKTLFLTGASGFVGAELLHRVLLREPDTSVICLVRGTSAHEAQERVVLALDQCARRVDGSETASLKSVCSSSTGTSPSRGSGSRPWCIRFCRDGRPTFFTPPRRRGSIFVWRTPEPSTSAARWRFSVSPGVARTWIASAT